ncbi:polysaccharide pyruvyl transferase family protein [Anaerofustis stercorihominis]|uniref:polysaccharide pyruvyl transferase family protein n=1 Tax=Anaerofustis stercorihominis TaxID=214853 RepID=UPI00214C34E5|nr:polysaccharide pyruvyl transferase family protein [Anaerofustis stercorihominis]MCR2033208.1 polysaccharide pyruvyl transferase family protein [Anaerofustis stercorihominis]
MKKILMRAGMAPWDRFSPWDMLVYDYFGTNLGNYMYAHSIWRALDTGNDVEIDADYYRSNADKAKKINSNYDYFIIPMADAFRNDFNLEKYTELVKKVKIPCILIGVGLRAPYEPNLEKGFEFDNRVRDFVSAVLDKSAMIGVRGQITADYLTKLGFREGVHHTVIGCPSLYMHGKELYIRDTEINEQSKICINASSVANAEVCSFIERNMRELQNGYYIPQTLKELRLLLTGIKYPHNPKHVYPDTLSHPVFQEDRVRFFMNTTEWIHFLRDADLTFGARLHGNIAATLAGCPSILFTKDSRTRELSEYHGLTAVRDKEIKSNTDLFELASKMDFHKVSKNQKRNFEHYIDFLDKNGLNHIYKNGQEPIVAPLDKKIDMVGEFGPVKSLAMMNKDEVEEYWGNIVMDIRKKESTIRRYDNKMSIKAYRKIKGIFVKNKDEEPC